MTDIMGHDLAVYFLFMLAAMSVLSLPLAPATLIAVKTSPPLAVAVAAAIAAGIAAIVDYHVIRRAFQLRKLDELRGQKLFQTAERWAKVAPFVTTAAFAGFPLPFTITRVLMPLSGYPLPRYAAAVALGRLPRIFVIASFGTVVEIPNELLIGALSIGIVIALAGALVRRLQARRRAATLAAAAAAPGAANDAPVE